MIPARMPSDRSDHAVIVRDALPAELAEVGEIRVSAYQAGGHMSPDSGYAPVLRALGAADDGTILVAVADHGADAVADRGADAVADHGADAVADHGAGRGGAPILGTVMLQYWPHAGQVVVGPGEAEIRALALSPEGQGRGTGRALLLAVIERAAQAGVRHLVLLTQPDMRTARRMYQQAGFRRLPDRDWSPEPGLTLLAYGMELTAAADAG